MAGEVTTDKFLPRLTEEERDVRYGAQSNAQDSRNLIPETKIDRISESNSLEEVLLAIIPKLNFES